MSICHIFAAGDFYGEFVSKPDDIIIAADAGYTHLEKLNIEPDILVGDFDTINIIPAHLSNIIRFPQEKDYTDTHLAIEEGISKGYKTFVVYGALGGKKTEHTIANIQLAAGYAEKGYDVTLTDGNNYVYAIHNSQLHFDSSAKGSISIFSSSDKSTGVTLSCLKYELFNATLTNTFALGVSNEFVGKDAVISVIDGTLIIITKQRRQDYEN